MCTELKVFASTMQTGGTTVMAVCALVCVLARQVHCHHDRADHALVFKDAPVSEEREAPCLFIEHDATAWRLLVLYVSGNPTAQPPLLPNIDVAARISPEIAVILSFA